MSKIIITVKINFGSVGQCFLYLEFPSFLGKRGITFEVASFTRALFCYRFLFDICPKLDMVREAAKTRNRERGPRNEERGKGKNWNKTK